MTDKFAVSMCRVENRGLEAQERNRDAMPVRSPSPPKTSAGIVSSQGSVLVRFRCLEDEGGTLGLLVATAGGEKRASVMVIHIGKSQCAP